jgi:methylated-DNA-[protein]-cysteine S-methyltransferase
MSEMNKLVFEIVRKIPKGKVVSYGDIAKFLGTRAYRAVAQILKTNKFPVKTPCHRVVKTDRRIGGYFGGTDRDAINYKKQLLVEEGILFDEINDINLCKIKKECFAKIEDFMN